MKRPPITPGPFTLKAGRNIETPSGTFYLAYGRDKDNSAPLFSSPTELDAIAKATAALPDLLETLESIAHDFRCSDNAEHARDALRLAGYEF
jgi:hypothetical protein